MTINHKVRRDATGRFGLSSQPVRSYLVIAAAIVIAGVLISASLFVAIGGAGTTVTVTVTTPCNEPVYGAGIPSTNASPVWLMQPGSTGTVCVTYQSSWQGKASAFDNQPFTQNFTLLMATETCAAKGCLPVPSYSFTVTGAPSSVQATSSTDFVTVVYTVTALGNATGFYDPGVTGFCNGGFPLAVGYAASQVNASDFTIIQPQGCVFGPPFQPVSMSVGGMGIMYVQF